MSENRQVARAAGLVGAYTLASRVGGLVRDAALGYAFGTGPSADAFFVAFRIPNLLRRYVAEGAVSVAFVPVFTSYLVESRADAIRAAEALYGVFAAGLSVLVAVAILTADWWVGFFAPGFASQSGKLALTVELTRILMPYLALISTVALFGGLLNTLRHFTAPAASPVLLNLSMIAAALFWSPRLREPVYGVAFGVLIGGVLQVALQLAALRREGIRLMPRWNPRHPAVRKVLGLMAPALFGAAVYQLNLLLSTVFASVLPPGSVSYLWYADRVFEFPQGIVAVAVGTAVLPTLSAHATRGRYDELRRSLSFVVRATSFLALPASAGILLLARPITAVLFRRGAFGAAEVEMTAWALQSYAAGLWAVSMVRILAPAFYALGDTRTPVLVASVGFVANLLFSVMLMGPVSTHGDSLLVAAIAVASHALSVWDLRHAGLALAGSLSASLNFLFLAMLLARRIGGLDLREIGSSILRCAVATAAMAPVVTSLASLADWQVPGELAHKTLVLGVAVGAGAATFLLTAWVVRCPEVAWARQAIGGVRRSVD
jgi:putative peptidoglycan lipid II flippase